MASIATSGDLEGLASLGACASEWQRRVGSYLEEVRAELQRAALDFRRSFTRSPLSGPQIHLSTKALDSMLQRFGVTGAMRVNVCAKLWQSGTAVGVFDTVTMMMTLLARASRAASPITVVYIWDEPRDCGLASASHTTPPRKTIAQPPRRAMSRAAVHRPSYVLLKRSVRSVRLLSCVR